MLESLVCWWESWDLVLDGPVSAWHRDPSSPLGNRFSHCEGSRPPYWALNPMGRGGWGLIVQGLIMRGGTFFYTDHSWWVSSDVASVSWLTLFPLNGPCRRRVHARSCVAHRGDCANKPDMTSRLLICAAFKSTSQGSLSFSVLGETRSCDLLVLHHSGVWKSDAVIVFSGRGTF